MSDDEQAIWALVETWMEASRTGDLETVLGLMSDDVLFMTPGREPFGKDEFAANSRAMHDVRIDGRATIQELNVVGDWAWLRNHIEIAVTPTGGETAHRAGYTLTVLRKESDGRWRLCRDANLVA
jgi:uncharacterized protein (TIGR02246 family)